MAGMEQASAAMTAFNDTLLANVPLGIISGGGGPSFADVVEGRPSPAPVQSSALAPSSAPRGDLSVTELAFVDNVVDEQSESTMSKIIEWIKNAAQSAGALKTASDVKKWARGSGNGTIVVAAIVAILGATVFFYIKNHKVGESVMDTVRRVLGQTQASATALVSGGVSAVAKRLNDARDLTELREYARMLLSADPAVAVRKHSQMRAILAMSPDDVAALVK